jgi:hypothetical protein
MKKLALAIATLALITPSVVKAAEAKVSDARAVDATIIDYKFGMVTLVGKNGPQTLVSKDCKGEFVNGQKVVIIHYKKQMFMVQKNNYTLAKAMVETPTDALLMLEPTCQLIAK